MQKKCLIIKNWGEIMLKIKDNVDLKELEKYGFEYEEDYAEENLEDLTKFYYNGGLYIFTDSRNFDDYDYGIRDIDKIYDLIKDGLVEKVKE